jgi:hypothetical protein
MSGYPHRLIYLVIFTGGVALGTLVGACYLPIFATRLWALARPGTMPGSAFGWVELLAVPIAAAWLLLWALILASRPLLGRRAGRH